MAEPVFSTSWYRVAALRPELRRHARIHRHSYRGEAWYVLQDLASGRFHRFTPDTHSIVARMDGSRTVDELWRDACERLGDAAPTQDELIGLLAQLHAADVLRADVPPDTAEILARSVQQRRRAFMGRWLSPFAVQIPLLDPDRWLRRAVPWLRPVLGWAGMAAWLALVLPAVALAAVHFHELTEGILDRALAPGNLVVIWLLFPFIKSLHELGHAAIARGFGAEVHELGVMLLVFTPVPYVDASATSAFPSKWQRMAVGAGGMLVEVALAALAMFVWANAQPGLVRVLAFNTLLIGGVTTLLFNANPLLRFDGYYILADWLEIPNLRQRSNRCIGDQLLRHVLRVPDLEPFDATPRERAWLIGFAIASFVWRVLVTFAIGLWVMSVSLPLGIALLAVSAVGWVGMPAYRAIRFLASSPQLARIRGLAASRAAGTLFGVLFLLAVVPFPFHTLSEGVVWIPDEAEVRAKVDGFVDEVVAAPGSRVEIGDVLLRCRDRALDTELEVARDTVRELEGKHDLALEKNLVDAQVVAEELGYARENLARVIERHSDLIVRAATAGTFVLPRARDLPGRFLAKGKLIGEVVDLEAIRVHAVIGQDDIDLVRERLRGVEVRPAEALGQVYEARVGRLVPGASGKLPHEALGSGGGGKLAVDPRDRTGHTALEKFFEVELQLPSDAGIVNAGGRVHVRFDHGFEPLIQQLWRRLRQVFLARLNVSCGEAAVDGRVSGTLGGDTGLAGSPGALARRRGGRALARSPGAAARGRRALCGGSCRDLGAGAGGAAAARRTPPSGAPLQRLRARTGSRRVRAGARGRRARARSAALRRAAHGWLGAPPRNGRGDGNRRGQDAGGDAPRGDSCPGGNPHAHRDGQRLSGEPRCRVDAARVPRSGPLGRAGPARYVSRRAPRGLCLRCDLLHEQGARLRLSARSAGDGARRDAGTPRRGTRARPGLAARSAGAARAVLRDRRRGRQRARRRGAHAADHQRPRSTGGRGRVRERHRAGAPARAGDRLRAGSARGRASPQ